MLTQQYAGVYRRKSAVLRTRQSSSNASLGKLEIHGPDAAEFLDRFYLNDLSTLKPMRARYGLMLTESGVIFTTTSAGAGRVLQWLEEWRQCEWPDLRVAIMPVREQWATISLCGPKARGILSQLESDVVRRGSAVTCGFRCRQHTFKKI